METKINRKESCWANVLNVEVTKFNWCKFGAAILNDEFVLCLSDALTFQ